MSDLKSQLRALNPDQRAALERALARQQATAPAAGDDGGPELEGQWFGLSVEQRSRWFLYRLDPLSQGTYNNVFCAEVPGGVDAERMAAALRTLLQRHPMLRAQFRDRDGQLEQCVQAHCGDPLKVFEVGDLDAEALRERVLADGLQAFDLAAPPLLRVHLYRRGDGSTILLLAFDHIAGDGWSYWQLLGELGELLRQPGPAAQALAPRPGYSRYVQAQREWLEGSQAQAQWRYWSRQLGGELPVLALPADRPRPARPSGRRHLARNRLDPRLAARLRELAKRHDTTLFCVLLAGYKILLHRYTGQGELIVGSPMPGRGEPRWNGVCGDFVNMVAFRTAVDADASVSALVARLRDTVFEGMAQQQYPFASLVERLQVRREADENPVFQTMFTFQKARHGEQLTALWDSPEQAAPVSWGGMDLRSYRLPHGGGNGTMGLVAEILELGDSLGYAMICDADRFEAATAERLAANFQAVLEAMVEDADAPVGRIAAMTAEERERVVEGFNRQPGATGIADMAGGWLIHDRVEAQAAARPHAVAIEHAGRSLPYGELNRRANRLAHRLIELGVGPDARVAICAERSPEMVIGVLAILKAGGGYVPLDPDYPADRLAYMLQDSAPAALLAQAGVLSRLPALATAASAMTVLDLDAELDAGLAAYPEHDPQVPGLAQEHLAYLIYTSGSTGRPKGVCMPRAGLANLLCWQSGVLEGPARSLQFAALGFDVAFQEIFSTLASGGTLVLPEERLRRDLSELAAWIQEQSIARLFLPYIALSGLCEVWSSRGAVLPELRDVIVAGEQLRITPAIRAFFAAHGRARLHNHYGPTESHVVTAHALPGPAQAWPDLPPIGAPIANARVYVLDAGGQPVPVGVAGEIHIGGPCLARGYRNRPELTEQRFIADPWAPASGARLYKTGDLGRWRADGALEYLGRNDFQVKIRGFRVEPGEIEAQLARCPGVREAAVIARAEAGEQRLIAYVTAQPGAQLSASALRQRLAQTLADYLLPSAYVILAALPLTPNGKLDRAALPAPDRAAVAADAYQAPQGQTEQAVAQLWQELLGLERVGRDDDFFALGGHSLMAVRLAAKLEQVLSRPVAMRELFARPVLKAFAAAIAQTEPPQQVGDEGAGGERAGIPRADRQAGLPLSWAQQRLWFIDQFDPAASVAYHFPAALRLQGELDRAALQRTLDRLVERHEILRTRFVPGSDGVPVQVIDPARPFDLAEEDLQHLAAQERALRVEALAVHEAHAAFDLAAGPPIRARLLRLGPLEHVLLITQHHIVSDGWSLRVLIGEVTALYSACCAGAADPLPPLPVQYADYALWQRSPAQEQRAARQLDYWTQQLAGAPQLLELPWDRPRPPHRDHAGATLPLRLEPSLVQNLRALSQRTGTTLFMTVLAAWSLLLSRLSGQDDVVVGVPVANRPHPELEPLLGCFVNTLALRVRLHDDPSVAQLLAQVKETTLQAHAHQDLPFERMVEAVQPARSLGHSPVFQAALSFDNTPGSQALQLPGLRLSPLPIGQDTAHFDLTLLLSESAQDGALVGGIEYASALFDRCTIERWRGHLLTLLEAMAADEEARATRLPLLTATERERLLHGLNPGAGQALAAYAGGLVHAAFESEAAARPQAIAVVCGTQSLSYGELDRRANQLAHRLIELGVGPDRRVAICVERGIEMLVGLLAILKAGGAYVPLDPQYPPERLAFMLEDCAPTVLLAQTRLREWMDSLGEAASGLPTLWLDGEAEAAVLARQPVHRPDAAARGLAPSHLAYVIYTSGSTGKPKGVMVEHRQVARLFRVTQDLFRFGREDVWTLFHSFAFDFSVWEIWGALSYGGRLVVVSDACARSPEDFHALLVQERVSVLNQTPGAFRALVAASARAQQRHGLRLVVFGGEAMDPRLLQDWAERGDLDATEFVNMYGITEITVHATWHRYRIEDLAAPRGNAIGRPLGDLAFYLLDADGEPVPVGVSGEIHIGGGGVARGYLNRPELTRQRFVPDRFGATPGGRLYRSGDLARWRPDGTLEYLGRNDFQVKIRGFRIELGEIEAQLSGCAELAEAVVVVREDTPGDQRLVAYVVPRPGAVVSAGALRERLSRALADYMLPSAYVELPALPLTPNGKLDRSALPAPDRAAAAVCEFQAPEGELEEAIAALWRDLLGLERIGRHDDFFALGGHSLLVTQLSARLRERFHIEVPIRALFEIPTLSAFAQYVHARQVERFLGEDAMELEQELDSMSEDQLRELLAEEVK